MWKFNTEIITPEKTIKYFLSENDKVLTCQEVLNLLVSSMEFRSFFNAILSDNKFDGYFFECRPFNKKSINGNFEFVLIRGDVFKKLKPNRSAFSKYFVDYEKVVAFPNLGKNATMVVPTPIAANDVYTHLANFVRQAPENQIDAFWKKVGEACFNDLSEKNIWLSTHGLGIYWLHIRVDTVPKYYHFRAYRNFENDNV